MSGKMPLDGDPSLAGRITEALINQEYHRRTARIRALLDGIDIGRDRDRHLGMLVNEINGLLDFHRRLIESRISYSSDE